MANTLLNGETQTIFSLSDREQGNDVHFDHSFNIVLEILPTGIRGNKKTYKLEKNKQNFPI